MEYRKCPHCGAQTPAALSRCKTCGHKVTDSVTFDYNKGDYVDNNADPVAVPRTRNGFVGFWLWFCFICNALLSIAFFALFFSDKGLLSAVPEPIWVRAYMFSMSLLQAISFMMLIRWRKAGFYILVVTGIVNIALSAVVGLFLWGILYNVLPLLILYLILRIRSNGVSCWNNLH